MKFEIVRQPALVCAVILVCGQAVLGAYVTPKMGGAQQHAPMVMPNVLFDGTNLSISGIVNHMGQPITEVPVLRPLVPPDEFDPTKPWAVLSGKAYNLQYGWNMSANSAFLPAGANIWIERLSATPGLETYERVTYNPIFGTAGSSSRWLWDGVMAHNAYAVPSVIGSWEAEYRLYLGDSTGQPLNGYGDTMITLQWTSIPEPTASLLLGWLITLTGFRRRTSRGTGRNVRHTR